MSDSEDRLNWIKNLIQLMCCDREIAAGEKKFLFKAAKELCVEVDDWNKLLKRVMHDERIRYPISDREMGIAALKSLVVMARADGHVDETEKRYILRFAKLIGLSNSEFCEIVTEIDVEKLFVPFRKISGNLVALEEDFDHIDGLIEVAEAHDKSVSVMTFDDFLRDSSGFDLVCFHASPEREATVSKCRKLLDNSGEKVISILSRDQGFQVRYMLELGLRRCVIEPVYSGDIEDIFCME